MRTKSLLLALLLLPLSAMAQTYLGYSNESVSRNNIFRYTSNTDQRLAMRLSEDKLCCLKGKTIKGIRIAFGSKNSTGSQATLWLSRSLGETPISSQTVTISATNKLVEYALPQSYTITGEEKELYVGCSLEIAANYGPFSSDFSKDLQNVFYAYANNEWHDLYGTGYGCPNIEVVLAEDVELTDVVLKPFEEKGYVKQGQSLTYKFQLQNFGNTPINSFDAEISVGQGKPQLVSVADVNIAPHATYDFTVDGIKSLQTGTCNIQAAIVNLNGKTDADEAPADNSHATEAYFYPSDMQRNVLLEVFTGQTCTNCPTAHVSLANAIQEAKDVNVVEIAHHSGFVTDIFTMKEDWTLTSLYNNSTYAPAAMFNRQAFGSAASPVVECSSASSDVQYLRSANKEHPYVSIAADSRYDKSTGKVNLRCRFYTHEQMPGEELRYSIWLVQDGLVASQKGGTADYVHNAVSRGCLTNSAWGEKGDFVVGQTYEVNKEFTLEDIIYSTSYEKEDGKNAIPTVLENMKIVVFVHQQSSNDVTGCRVFNCAEVGIGDDVTQGGFPVETTRVLKRQSYYGDSQGVESEAVVTRTLDYCYNDQNQLLRTIERAKNTNEDHWELVHYFIRDYDEQGHLLRTNSLQYGAFDYDQLGWLPANDTVTYEYDAQGLLVKEHHPNVYYTYEYDDKGLMVVRDTWKINSFTGEASHDLSEAFSDFNDAGQPSTVEASSPAGKEWNEYTGKMVYDTNGNLTSEKHYSHETPSVLTYAEYWKYSADGRLMEHLLPTVFGDGSEVDNQKELYTLFDGMGDLILREGFVSDGDGTWYPIAGSKCLEEYTYIPLGKAPKLKLSADALSAAPNSVLAEVEGASNAEVVFYRSGLLLDTVVCENGQAALLDAEVKNGTYEYIVLDGAKVSNIVSYTHHVDLPAVTNLRFVSAEKDLLGDTYVTLAWTNPTIDSQLPFLCRNLYYENMRVEEATTDDQAATTLVANFGTERIKQMYVQTRYKYGYANSEAITIDLDNLPDAILAVPSEYNQNASSVQGSFGTQPVFDLQGRLTKPSQRGIYLKSGKKVVVR